MASPRPYHHEFGLVTALLHADHFSLTTTSLLRYQPDRVVSAQIKVIPLTAPAQSTEALNLLNSERFPYRTARPQQKIPFPPIKIQEARGTSLVLHLLLDQVEGWATLQIRTT
eukprot:873444-Amphidinium_carterae.1